MFFKGIFSKISLFTGLLFLSGLINAQNAEQQYKSSLEYASKGAYQQALIVINKALASDSSKSAYYLQRAEINYALEKYNKTIEDCYTILRQDPKNPSVYLLRGKVCTVTESFGGAILFFGKTIKYTNNKQLLFEAYLNRGKAFIIIKRYSEAYSDLQKALEIDGSSLEILLSLSETYMRMGNNIEAVNTIKKAIALNPDYAPVYKLYGEIAHQNQDFPQAISAYNEYISLNPKNSSVYNLLASLYLETMQLNEAMLTLNTSLTIDPQDSKTYKIKGMVYIMKGEQEKGCNTLFRAMQLGYFEKYDYGLLDIYLKHCEK